MTTPAPPLPTVEIDGVTFDEVRLCRTQEWLTWRTMTERDLSLLLAKLSPEQKERVLGPYESERLRDYQGALQTAREGRAYQEMVLAEERERRIRALYDHRADPARHRGFQLRRRH